MKKLILVGILMSFAGVASASTIVCRVIENVGLQANGKYKAQNVYDITEPIAKGDMNSQITVMSKYIKNVKIDVFACESCSTIGTQRFDEINGTLTATTTGYSSVNLVQGDNLLSEFTLKGGDTLAIDCTIGKK